jgi:hypothetical protein
MRTWPFHGYPPGVQDSFSREAYLGEIICTPPEKAWLSEYGGRPFGVSVEHTVSDQLSSLGWRIV